MFGLAEYNSLDLFLANSACAEGVRHILKIKLRSRPTTIAYHHDRSTLVIICGFPLEIGVFVVTRRNGPAGETFGVEFFIHSLERKFNLRDVFVCGGDMVMVTNDTDISVTTMHELMSSESCAIFQRKITLVARFGKPLKQIHNSDHRIAKCAALSSSLDLFVVVAVSVVTGMKSLICCSLSVTGDKLEADWEVFLPKHTCCFAVTDPSHNDALFCIADGVSITVFDKSGIIYQFEVDVWGQGESEAITGIVFLSSDPRHVNILVSISLGGYCCVSVDIKSKKHKFVHFSAQPHRGEDHDVCPPVRPLMPSSETMQVLIETRQKGELEEIVCLGHHSAFGRQVMRLSRLRGNVHGDGEARQPLRGGKFERTGPTGRGALLVKVKRCRVGFITHSYFARAHEDSKLL